MKVNFNSNPALTARRRLPAWPLAVLLVLLTVALYWPATRHDFIDYDDDLYVTANVHVQNGLNWENLKWAFLNPVDVNWHPVTMLSHMLDCQLFGLQPRGHHLTSVLLHALNAALVFALLLQLTSAMWRSWLVAALFAVHPLHVESVAWVAERKDVLSGFFGLLSLIFYARYVRRRFNAQPSTLNLFYWLALFFFALGLMSKAMLITWPFAMLLLDYWPLGRFGPSTLNPQPSTIWRLVAEKIPFFLFAAVVGVVNFLAQRQGGALTAVEKLPLGARAGNALVSYCRYLGKLFWPADLAVIYPHPGYWPLVKVLLAGGLLFALTVLFFLRWSRYPFLLMGWLWFVGTLVPVIQLVQTGSHAMADRYTYLPSIGLFILVIWGVHKLTRCWPYQVITSSLAGAAAIVLCLALTRQQLGYWQDSETLFRHAIAVTENNFMAYNDLGYALGKQGQTDQAILQFQEAIRLKPGYAYAHNNLGFALAKKDQIDDAVRQYQEAIRLKPDYAYTHNNLGVALFKEGQIAGAISQYQEAIRLKPDYAEAYYDLGVALDRQGQPDEAIRQYHEAIDLQPDYAAPHKNLADALYTKRQFASAITNYERVMELAPQDPASYNDVAWMLATCPEDSLRNGPRALELARRADTLSGGQIPEMISTLAAAYAEDGQFSQAIAVAERGLKLAIAQTNTEAASSLRGQISLAKAGLPFRDLDTNAPIANH